ncbi:hypothetical protein TNIN_403361 [Trichonephila inaurata madagascariensis]|uniref:THAP-type domain-containing protein n=1 Tax=Trichonephila inaurata madagascariensis TaxID=2747483 RepID=A0A8X6X9R6_9ARAC|nr:hypothetical protein TNIN_403361 [Trichonephila inaurata madagascariensis]
MSDHDARARVRKVKKISAPKLADQIATASGKKICELHFADDSIRRNSKAYDEKTGEKICVPLKRLRLQNFVVPIIFKSFPKYLSNSTNPARECPEHRQQRLENEHFQRSIQENIHSQ